MKNWLKKSVHAYGTISILIGAAAMAQPTPPKPAIALVNGGDAAQWQAWASQAGWQVITPMTPSDASLDSRIQSLHSVVMQAIQAGSADPARIYLAGRDAAAVEVFYAISRVPDLWAAAVALGGSPQSVADTGRLYAANFTNVPLLWISPSEGDRKLAEKLKNAGMPLEWRAAWQIQMGSVFEWLARHLRPQNPPSIDCETDSPQFARCYWISMTKLDAAERNDVLPSSAIAPRVRAELDLGGFGFKIDAPGPGVLISYLPPKYNGPLKMGDRIIELDGLEIQDARQYEQMMAQIKEERAAVVMVQRGKDRIRIETNVLLPKRAAAVTARVQANYDAAGHEIDIISRAVTEMRVTIPAAWVPVVLNWNGVPLGRVEKAGCRLLSISQELESAAPCS